MHPPPRGARGVGPACGAFSGVVGRASRCPSTSTFPICTCRRRSSGCGSCRTSLAKASISRRPVRPCRPLLYSCLTARPSRPFSSFSSLLSLDLDETHFPKTDLQGRDSSRTSSEMLPRPIHAPLRLALRGGVLLRVLCLSRRLRLLVARRGRVRRWNGYNDATSAATATNHFLMDVPP